MSGPAFHRPATLDEAIDLLARHGGEARAVAGSTAVGVLVRQGLVRPAALVSLAGIPGLAAIERRGDVIVLGALVRHRAVERDPLVRDLLPVLAGTFGLVASPRVRNAATVGGVLAEADYASDPPAVLAGLGATIVTHGPGGGRRLPAEGFATGFYQTLLEPAELVTAVEVPVPAPGTTAVYRKFVSRSSEDRPCVGVFASVRRTAGAVAEVRVVVGAAAERPVRHADLDALGAGTDLGDPVIARLADGYAERVDALADVRGSAWYRREMTRVWVRRALEAARDGTGPAAAREP